MGPTYRVGTPAEQQVLGLAAGPDETVVVLDEDGLEEAVLSPHSGRWFVPLAECHCGEMVTYEGRWEPRQHRRCYLIP